MKNFYALIVSATLALSVSSAVPRRFANSDSVPFNVCEGASSTVTIESLTLNPNPPSIKKPLAITFSSKTSVAITKGARLKVVTKLGSMEVDNQTIDLCEEAAKSGLNCPIPAGAHDFTTNVKLPKNVPPFTSLDVHAEGTNGDNNALFCFNTKLKFVP